MKGLAGSSEGAPFRRCLSELELIVERGALKEAEDGEPQAEKHRRRFGRTAWRRVSSHNSLNPDRTRIRSALSTGCSRAASRHRETATALNEATLVSTLGVAGHRVLRPSRAIHGETRDDKGMEQGEK